MLTKRVQTFSPLSITPSYLEHQVETLDLRLSLRAVGKSLNGFF